MHSACKACSEGIVDKWREPASVATVNIRKLSEQPVHNHHNLLNLNVFFIQSSNNPHDYPQGYAQRMHMDCHEKCCG